MDNDADTCACAGSELGTTLFATLEVAVAVADDTVLVVLPVVVEFDNCNAKVYPSQFLIDIDESSISIVIIDEMGFDATGLSSAVVGCSSGSFMVRVEGNCDARWSKLV